MKSHTWSLKIGLILQLTLLAKQTLATSSSPKLNYEKKVTFTPGTFAEYEEDPIFYDGYLPLVFQFQVPKHMENAMKIMWSHATVCNTSDSRYDGKLCPVVHHLHKIVANLSQDMGFWKDFLPDTPPALSQDKSNSTQKSITSPLSPNCVDIKPHFRNPYTPHNQLDQYLKSLTNCPLSLQGNVEPPIAQEGSWIIDKQIYYTMVDRFYSEFYRSLPGTGNIDWVVTLNSYTAIQSLLLSNNYMESSRLMEAWLQCREGYIPHSFITRKMIQDALKRNFGKVKEAHLSYLWDHEKIVEGIHPYFSLPLTDCTLSDDHKLIVRVLIPVKNPEIETRLVKVKTFPFLEKVERNSTELTVEMNLCKLQTPFGESVTFIQSSSGLLFENGNGCVENRLCKRNDLTSFLPVDSCVSAILTGNETLLEEECKLACFPLSQKSLPIFQRLSKASFLAIGSSEDKVFIQCNGHPLERIELVNYGALEIKLPCNCQLSYRNLALQPDQGDCGEGPSIRHLLPLQWRRRLIANWTGSGNANASEMDLDEATLERKMRDQSYFHYKVVQGNDSNISNGSSTISNERQVSFEKYEEREVGAGAGMVVQICLMWILLLALIGANGWLLYEVFQLRKWRKMEVYKDARIVYSVPPSPQFPNKF